MTRWFVIGDGQSALSDREFVVVAGDNAEAALEKYIVQVGIRDEFFVEHIYTRGINSGLSKSFFLVTPQDNERYWTTGQAPIDEVEFERRVRDFFGQGNDYADRYLRYYFLDSQTESTSVLFPADMLAFIFNKLRQSENWMNLQVIPLDEVMLE
jgi:hypothetical protein